MRKLILFVLLINSGLLHAIDYPKYEVILNEFFNKYTYSELPAGTKLEFQKRPTGWHIAIIDYYQNITLKNEIFWDSSNGSYKKLSFDKKRKRINNSVLIQEHSKDWNNRYYDIFPYWGYIGYSWDVIQNYKDASNLSEDYQYALGRSYSNYAADLLNNNSGMADQKKQFVIPDGKNALTPAQLKEYLFYQHKAIEIFKSLAIRNPNYETIIGSIGNKAANEHLTSYLNVCIYQNSEEAYKELADNIYSDFLISTAKNYLNSCAPNAILFCNGDNDTYPLLYVQAKLGIRRDVLLVNLSLLQWDRYEQYIRNNVFDSPGLELSFTKEQLSGYNRAYVMIDKTQQDSISVSEALTLLKKDKLKVESEGQSYFVLPTNKFWMKYGEKEISWEINTEDIVRNHLILMDLLETNKWKRPIYFSLTMSDDSFFGLQSYLQLEGLAFRLVENKTGRTGFQYVNSSVLYTNLMNKFEWKGIDTLILNEKLFCSTYRIIFSSLADRLIHENKLDSALQVLDKCIELIPNNNCYYNVTMLFFVEAYYRLNEFEKGNAIVKQLMYNVNNNKHQDFESAIQNWEEDKRTIKNWLYIYTNQYGQNMFGKELREYNIE